MAASIEVNIVAANTYSIALAKRMGLRKEGISKAYLNIGGEWCDHERWAILDKEWEERWIAIRCEVKVNQVSGRSPCFKNGIADGRKIILVVS